MTDPCMSRAGALLYGAMAGTADGPEAPSQASRVVQKIEYISDAEGKRLVLAKWASLAAAVGLLLWGVTAKLNEVRCQQPAPVHAVCAAGGRAAVPHTPFAHGATLFPHRAPQDPNYLLRSNLLSQVSTPFAALCVAANLGALLLLGRRLWWAHAAGKRWTPRQRWSVGLAALSCALSLVNATCWLANLAYTWANECSWFRNSGELAGALAAREPTVPRLPPAWKPSAAPHNSLLLPADTPSLLRCRSRRHGRHTVVDLEPGESSQRELPPCCQEQSPGSGAC